MCGACFAKCPIFRSSLQVGRMLRPSPHLSRSAPCGALASLIATHSAPRSGYARHIGLHRLRPCRTFLSATALCYAMLRGSSPRAPASRPVGAWGLSAPGRPFLSLSCACGRRPRSGPLRGRSLWRARSVPRQSAGGPRPVLRSGWGPRPFPSPPARYARALRFRYGLRGLRPLGRAVSRVPRGFLSRFAHFALRAPIAPQNAGSANPLAGALFRFPAAPRSPAVRSPRQARRARGAPRCDGPRQGPTGVSLPRYAWALPPCFGGPCLRHPRTASGVLVGGFAFSTVFISGAPCGRPLAGLRPAWFLLQPFLLFSPASRGQCPHRPRKQLLGARGWRPSPLGLRRFSHF